MAIEIEAKLSVPDLDVVRARLRDVGAQPVSSQVETNTFFDTEDRSLLAADEGLRLRRTVDDETKHVAFVITFKGPRKHGPLKSREETELGVLSDRDAGALLSRLGYSRILSFEKHREKWKLEGCQIELDTLPYLGTFVEIEGPGEAVILKVREQLRLNDRPIVKNSYVALMMNYLQERNDSSRTVTFDGAKSERDKAHR